MAFSAVIDHQHTSLPRPLTSMVGRQGELDRLLDLLDDPAVRLVTIIGPGGVGKTRLALHLAATLVDEFDREVVFVPLAAIREPDLLLTEISRAVGITPPAGTTAGDALVEALRDRDLLLVLDNMEQILPAAAPLAEFLARCPNVRAVVTSRAALGVAGEHRLPLAPLPLAPLADTGPHGIRESDAVSLFVARARAIRPGLVLDDQTVDAIAGICRRLDGLPLAIELAAARLNILSPQALLARLGNRLQLLGTTGPGVPDRLRTMRQAIAWSYDLLTPAEQALFRRLSVFAGGCTLSAAEAICEGLPFAPDALQTLGSLVDHSLVTEAPTGEDEPRYGMLETLREFGAEQLTAQDEEEDARSRHAAWCAALAEQAEPHFVGSDQAAWIARLDAEWDNIRVACTWATESGKPDVALRILAALRKFITSRGHTIVASSLLDRALAATANIPTVVRCRGLLAAGNLAEDQRDMARARVLLEEARDLAIETGDGETRILALVYLSHEAHDRGDYVTAIERITQAIGHATAIGNDRLRASALGAMGNIHYFMGELEHAERRWEESRVVVRELGDRRAEATMLGNLGALASARGDARRAVDLQRQAIDVAEAVNDDATIAIGLVNLAENLRTLGDLEEAAGLAERGTAMLRDYGLHGYADQGQHMHASIALAQGRFDQAVALQQASLAGFITSGDQRSIADSAVLLAEICLACSEPAPAIELLGIATTLRERIGIDVNPVQAREMSDLVSRLRRRARDAEYDRCWQAGRNLDAAAVAGRLIDIGRALTSEPQDAAARPASTPAPGPLDALSAREREVIALLVEGRSAREIGETLFISPRTATTHINNIYAKLGVTTRAQAVAWAVRAGVG